MLNESSERSFDEFLNNGTFAFPLHLLPFGLSVVFFGFFATFGNVMILLGVCKVPELRKNNCNILISNLAFADLLSSLHFVLIGTLACLGSLNNEKYLIMTNEHCFYVCTSAIWSFNAGSFMILAVGVDRMIATVFPVFYMKLSKNYACSLIGASWVFGCVNYLLAYISKQSNVIVPACVLPTALFGISHQFWNQSNLLITVLVVIMYFVAYKKLGRPRTSTLRDSQTYKRNKHLLNSFIIIVVIYVLCWAVTMLVIFFVRFAHAEPTVIFHSSLYVGILANLNVGCNFYVYYLRSREYRKELKKIFAAKTHSFSDSRKLLMRRDT